MCSFWHLECKLLESVDLAFLHSHGTGSVPCTNGWGQSENCSLPSLHQALLHKPAHSQHGLFLGWRVPSFLWGHFLPATRTGLLVISNVSILLLSVLRLLKGQKCVKYTLKGWWLFGPQPLGGRAHLWSPSLSMVSDGVGEVS